MFRENETIGSYKILYPIDRGGIGTIYLAVHQNLDKYVVLKEVMIRGVNALDFRREANILKNLRHTYLPNIYDLIMQPDRVITVMDFIPGQNFDKLPAGKKQLSEEQLLKWMRQMAEVLEYLENQVPPVIHSDIKPGNIILQPNGDICLIDFNISFVQNARQAVYGYSKRYSSPEQLFLIKQAEANAHSDIMLDVRTDIYSTGATFYYLITGQYPTEGRPVVPLSEFRNLPYSDAFLAIIDRCMQWKRENRYQNAESLLRAIDNLKKQDRKYKFYTLWNVMSYIGSAILIAGGIFMILHGMGLKTNEEFLRAVRSLKYSVESGEDAEEEALGILNNETYQLIIDNSPEAEANVKTLLGDVYYRRKDYVAAASAYKEALEAADRANLPDMADYYNNLGIAYAYSGKTEEAQKLLDEAMLKGVKSLTLLQMQEGVYKVTGKKAECERTAEEILTKTSDPDILARTCIIVADMYMDSQRYGETEEWLDKAARYSSNPEILERKAKCYILWMGAVSSQSEKRSLAELSLGCYQRIASDRYVLIEDRINLAIVYRILGRYDESNAELEQVLLQDDDNCTALMYLAINSYDLGEISEGNRCAIRANEVYRMLMPEERMALDGQLVRELNVRASSHVGSWERMK